jgi:hypothetical protein
MHGDCARVTTRGDFAFTVSTRFFNVINPATYSPRKLSKRVAMKTQIRIMIDQKP